MTYNVENLLDTTHDEGKDDYTFLPLKLKKTHPECLAACKKNQSPYREKECLETDWSDEILETKLTRLAESIGQINNGQGPDIQILEEVENLHVLNMLADHLPAAAYTTGGNTSFDRGPRFSRHRSRSAFATSAVGCCRLSPHSV